MQPNHFFFHGWSNGFPSLWKERITGLDPQDSERAPGARWLWVPTPSFPAVCFAPQFYFYKMGMMSLTRGCLAQGRYWRNISSIYIPTFPPNSLHTQEKSETLEARRMGPFHVFPFFFFKEAQPKTPVCSLPLLHPHPHPPSAPKSSQISGRHRNQPSFLSPVGTLIGMTMHRLPGEAWSREEAAGVFPGLLPVPSHHRPPTQEKGLNGGWRPEAHPGQGVILS